MTARSKAGPSEGTDISTPPPRSRPWTAKTDTVASMRTDRRSLSYASVLLLVLAVTLIGVRPVIAADRSDNAADEPAIGTLAIPNDYEGRDGWTDSPSGENWHHELIGLPEAWDISTGTDDLVLTVIDHDIQPAHPDLVPNHRATNRLAEGLSSGASHGTAVAGIACAQGNDALGISGTAWDCGLRLWDIRTSANPPTPGDASADTAATISATDMVLAMDDAVDKGSSVVNLSLGGPEGDGCDVEPSPTAEGEAEALADRFREPIERGRARAAAGELGADIVWVFAAGNGCKDVAFSAPARLATEFDNVLAVTAVNSDGSLAPFANFGDGVSVAAGGGFDLSSLPENPTPEEAVKAWRGGVFTTAARTVCKAVETVTCDEEYGYRGYAGTSMAAPAVSGVAVLVRTAHPELTAAATVRCITESAHRVGPQVTAVPSSWFEAARAVGWPSVKRYSDSDLDGLHIVDAPAAVACDFPTDEIELLSQPSFDSSLDDFLFAPPAVFD